VVVVGVVVVVVVGGGGFFSGFGSGFVPTRTIRFSPR
jgi:hypothetical protein